MKKDQNLPNKQQSTATTVQGKTTPEQYKLYKKSITI